MMAAFAENQDTVSLDILKSAIAELRWSEYAARSAKLPILKRWTDTSSTGTQHPVADSSHALAHLLLSRKGESIGEYKLIPGRFLIGRTLENDLPIDSQFISRHHAQIISSDGSSIIEDLNSTNGITHNGKRIRRRVLNDGDVLQIGEHELAYMDERQTRSRPRSRNSENAARMFTETTNLPESMAIKKGEASHDDTIAED
jgi:hypothetical protein